VDCPVELYPFLVVTAFDGVAQPAAENPGEKVSGMSELTLPLSRPPGPHDRSWMSRYLLEFAFGMLPIGEYMYGGASSKVNGPAYHPFSRFSTIFLNKCSLATGSMGLASQIQGVKVASSAADTPIRQPNRTECTSVFTHAGSG
jgi:hypothetical protein